MTTTSGPRRVSRLLMLAGHYSPVAFVALAAMIITTDVTRHRWQVLNLVAYAVIAVWVFCSASADDYHVRYPCARCMRHAPLDPEAGVRKWRPALRWHHRPFVQVLSAAASLGLVYLVSGLPTGWHVAADAMVIGVAATVFASGVLHRRLRPWCPWCKPWDEGGDAEAVPDPDPDPAVSK